MTIFGYARVSTDGQSLASQDAQLHAAGCAKVYAEKVSGARADRLELAKVLRRLQAGDVLMVTRPRPGTCSISSIPSANRAPALNRWVTLGPTPRRRMAG
jgi:hypothetical protein